MRGLAALGIDGPSGTSRYTFDVPQLFDGIDIVVITVGLLALGEVFHVASRIKKDPEFGTTGSIKGLAAPEAAGNATAGTAMGTLLALGLPTSATAAIMLAAFQQYGMQPGPLLFERSGDMVWTLLASLFIALFVLLAINLLLAPAWARLLYIPNHYLYAGITVIAMLGVYAISASIVDLIILIVLGFLGFLMRRYNMPLAPLLIGVILGPLAETELRRALAVSEGDPSILVSSPITIAVYVFLIGALAVSAFQHLRHRNEKKGPLLGGKQKQEESNSDAAQAPVK